jgi:hypothetical protein
MSTVTDGPWIYDTDSATTFMVFPDVEDEEGGVVCRGIRNEADARLLAGSKEMAEQLLAVERWMSGYGTKTQSEMRSEIRNLLTALGMLP